MLIKFFGGRGGGGGIANYLVDPTRPGREDNAPEVLRGDIDQTRELIDSQDRKWTFTTGVISFAPTDAPSEKDQMRVMDDFERLAFAGLERDQYDITWVRHSHTGEGRVELHFLVPRMELSTGKALNIAPPGWEKTFAPLRDAWNYEKGWARPDDPARARTQQWAFERPARGDAREAITSYLEDRIVTGQVENRAGLVGALKEVGFEVPREGKDYVTALDPESGERWRLKGRIYERDWTREAEFVRATESQIGRGSQGGGDRDPGRAREARGALEAIVGRRAGQNKAKYQRPDHGDREGDRLEPQQDEKRADRDRDASATDHAADRDPERRDRSADRDPPLGGDDLSRDVPDRRDAGALDDQTGAGGRDRGDGGEPSGAGRGLDPGAGHGDLPGGSDRREEAVHLRHAADPLRQADGVGPHGQIDQLRNRLVERVRELGQGVRNLGERLKEHGAAAYNAVRSLLRGDIRPGGPSERARGEAVASDRSLEQAERLNTSADRQRHQIDGRAAALEKDAEMQDRVQEIIDRQRDRGFER